MDSLRASAAVVGSAASRGLDNDDVLAVDALILRHRVVPGLTVNCRTEAVPSVSISEFLRDDCTQNEVVIFALSDPRALLAHWRQMKSRNQRKSALIVLPDPLPQTCRALTKGMVCVERTTPERLGVTRTEYASVARCAVWYDAPKVVRGVIAQQELPPAIQALHVHSDPGLTFVFQGQLAGLPAQVLWDSGAALSFVDAAYVARHQLTVKPTIKTIELADGDKQSVSGYVRMKLRIQGSLTWVQMYVMSLLPEYDVILGDDWSHKYRISAFFGGRGNDRDPTYLKLGRGGCRLVPEGRSLDTSHAHREAPVATDAMPSNVGAHLPCDLVSPVKLLSVTQARRLLASPRTGCAPAYLVVVNQVKEDCDVSFGPAAAAAQSAVDTILTDYEVVFEAPSTSHVRPGLTPDAVPLMEGAKAPNVAAYRQSVKERQVLEETVKEQLEKGWLQPSNSPFGAPVLFVPKPDGSLRMCIDYRALNKVTHRNTYPLPRIDDLMDNLSGAKYFSSLDLTSGYHQLVLSEEDRPKTAFNTHFGKFEYKVLPMGLCNAPAVFQSAMNTLFGPLLNRCVCVYLDDILIFSRSEKEHLRHLRMVLTVLKDNDLKAKRSKCKFFVPELKFLGHIVSAEGIRPDPRKVETVHDWPTPVSAYEVRQFHGLANYFRKFIRGFAATAAPLTDLLKGIPANDRTGKLLRYGRLPQPQKERMVADFKAKWTPQCQTSFDALKHALTSAPVLAMPDPQKPYVMVADACECPPAIGAVLIQDGRPVSFFSRKLKGAELQYSASDIEMQSVISALKEWRCYLEGAPKFTIVTDHEPNTYLDQKTVNPHTHRRRARWLAASCGYDYQWQYRPGRTNVADPISRAPQHFRLACVRACVRACPCGFASVVVWRCTAAECRGGVGLPPSAETVACGIPAA